MAKRDVVALGRVQGVHSLTVLVADADVAKSWKGLGPPVGDPMAVVNQFAPGNDADRADEAIARDTDTDEDVAGYAAAEIAVGAGAGLVIDVGGSGVAEVFRVGGRIVIVEGFYEDDLCSDIKTLSDDEIHIPRVAAFDDYVMGVLEGRTKRAGVVDVPSGWLALMPTFSACGSLGAASQNADGGEVIKVQTEEMEDAGDELGLLVRVESGRYAVVLEIERELGFGSVSRAILEPSA